MNIVAFFLWMIEPKKRQVVAYIRFRYHMALCVLKKCFLLSIMTRDMPDRIEFPKDHEFDKANGGRFNRSRSI